MDLLIDPLHTEAAEFLQRPQKRFRAELVRIGFATLNPSGTAAPEGLDELCAAIEELHSGSLIIDDIQDHASERRGQPAKHHQIGLERAINLGNWLYFQSLSRITQGPFSMGERDRLLGVAMSCLSDAHLGQELDLRPQFLKLSPVQMTQHARESIRLKTGALTRLAILWGAILTDASDRYNELGPAAEKLGVLLQQCEDLSHWRKLSNLGNKSLEEISSGRPSFFWQVLSEHLPEELPAFVAAWENFSHAPDELRDLCQRSKILEIATEQNHVFLRHLIDSLHSREDIFDDQAVNLWLRLIERIVSAY